MDKNYNFERKKLMLPEYGRHVHQMVDYLKTIHDRDLRNQQARAVIEVMGNLNPIRPIRSRRPRASIPSPTASSTRSTKSPASTTERISRTCSPH